MPPLAPLQAHREKYRAKNEQADTQLGENRDYTTMIHSLGIHDPTDFDKPEYTEVDDREPGEPLVASLPSDIWMMVADYLDPTETANLASATVTLYRRLGPRPWKALKRPENRDYKNNFLIHLDGQLPHHLLCFPCGIYHVRAQEGHERLQPADVLNPLFNCPNSRNVLRPAPRHRITHNRNLPFSFVQLVTRAARFTPSHGLPVPSLSRRWRRDGWTHHTRYHLENGHLLMRVVSSAFASPNLPPAAQRILLYSRDDYWPYFSVCAHWRDGELMESCKCALSHIPAPRETSGPQRFEYHIRDRMAGRNYDPNQLATLCGKCRPMRRCPLCPTEYMIEIKLTEDRSDAKSTHFRHAIVVTRWSDLGDGSSPTGSAEWAACNGDLEGYDSFAILGRRAISGSFESAISADTLPGQRVISLNPKGKRLGEEGNNWY